MKKRFFNLTGHCDPVKHYTVNPLRGFGDKIMKLIEKNLYFVIHAPRQMGKTTLLHSLTRQLNESGKYTALVFSVERAGYSGISMQEANIKMIDAISSTAPTFLPEEKFPPNKFDYSQQSLYNYILDWTKQLEQPLVLFIDEIDSLYDQVLISVLRQLRDGFQIRPEAFPASLALVGLRDVRDYKDKVRDETRSIGSGSPFNIKTRSFTLPNFSMDELELLYMQHSKETNQIFSKEVTNLIYEYTNGQPWLCNAIAEEITEEILEGDYSKEITVKHVVQAKENLIHRRDTHLDSLMDKLEDSRIKPIISSIISGNKVMFDAYNDNIQYAIDLGIVRRSEQGVIISNKIYNEIIPRELNIAFADVLQAEIDRLWYIDDEGNLLIDKLLQSFQDFYRENSETWIEQFSYKEAGKQLLLMAYLQRVVNSGGQISREMAVGRGRTDLVVDYANQRFVLELKNKNKNYKAEKAYQQLSRYLDTLGETKGYLILFEEKPASEISWAERIKREEIQYEYMNKTVDIIIVEM